MKHKEMPIAKTAVQELSGEALEELRSFGKSEIFKLLSELAEKEKYHRFKTDFLVAESTDEINLIRGVAIGMDFIMDSVERAKQEIKRRSEIDKEEENK